MITFPYSAFEAGKTGSRGILPEPTDAPESQRSDRLPRFRRLRLPRRLLASGLLAVGLGATACSDEVVDPIPHISELQCNIEAVTEDPAAPENNRYRVVLDFRYTDRDRDLDDAGAQLLWWVNEVPQSPYDLSDEGLGDEGTLSLAAAPLLPFESYAFKVSVIDAAGNESNALNAYVDTDAVVCSGDGV